MNRRYDLAAYIWPSYHYEPRAERFWPEKDGEWYTVRRAAPRFPGHDMPRIPLLGYQDEADPAVGRQHVELAARHGINVFIMDWYWYEQRPCFERQLNDALIPALRNTPSKFYLMWANHDADTLWDMHTDERRPVWDGKVDRDAFEPMMDRIIEKYFRLDSYYRIDGKPVFSIFLLNNLTVGLGGVDAARDAVDWLRSRVREKDFPGIHLQTIVRSGPAGPESTTALKGITNEDLAGRLGVDSATNYHFADFGVREGDYLDMARSAMDRWEKDAGRYPMLFPHVSVGWDNTQRNPSLKKAVTGHTPAAFKSCLRRAKAFADSRPNQPPLITLNSWNEWTEGSYLLPDLRWGYAYLEAVGAVFNPSRPHPGRRPENKTPAVAYPCP